MAQVNIVICGNVQGQRKLPKIRGRNMLSGYICMEKNYNAM